MRHGRWLRVSDVWFRTLLRLYPADFRDEMGDAVVEAHRDRLREAVDSSRMWGLAGVWWAAFRDSMRNGLGERLRPAVSWRRSGNWGRDMELVSRRLRRSLMFVVAILGTLTVGLASFAVVNTVVDKVLIEPIPFGDPDDLYLTEVGCREK